MKKIISLFLSVLITAAIFTAFPASAESLKTDDGVYTYEVVSGKYIRLLSCVAPDKVVLNADGSYTIPSEVDGKPVKYLGKKLFQYDDVPAARVIIPDGVEYIEAEAFYCNKLDGGAYKTYRHQSMLEEITLPDTITYIGDRAFYDSKIYEINLPDSLLTIDDEAFACSCLESVVVPESVRSLGAKVFYDCEELESAVVKAPVKVLRESLFDSCKILSKLSLPDTITKIETKALNCNSLKKINVKDSVELGDFALGYGNYGYLDDGRIITVSYVKGEDNHRALYKTLSSGYNVEYVIPNADRGHIFNAGTEVKLRVDGTTAKSWKSENPKVAKISSDGKVIAKRSGVTNVTATLADGSEFTCRVRTIGTPWLYRDGSRTRIYSSKALKIKKGEFVKIQTKLKAKSIPNTYTSKSVAKIHGNKNSEYFYVEGKKRGTATLAVTVNGKKLKFKVNVV